MKLLFTPPITLLVLTTGGAACALPFPLFPFFPQSKETMINGARIVTRYEQTRANSSAMHEELCFNRQLTLLDYGDIIHAWAILGVLTLMNISCVLRDNDEN